MCLLRIKNFDKGTAYVENQALSIPSSGFEKSISNGSSSLGAIFLRIQRQVS